MKISLLTGGKDPHYVLGLLSGLIAHGIEVDLIGSDEMEAFDIVKNENVNFYNFRRGEKPKATIIEKIIRVVLYYMQLVRYAAKTDSKLFHIQWLNKFTYFDRTLLNLYYKLLNKKIVFTAHNVNDRQRDGNDTLLNKITLKFLYNIVDCVIVHTEKMKEELVSEFDIIEKKIFVIPFGINNMVPVSKLSKLDAKQKLNLKHDSKNVLFFGNIAPYKGLEYLISAIAVLKRSYSDLKLIIAGRVKKDCEKYWDSVEKQIDEYGLSNDIIKKIEFIPDEDIEIYYKSADVLILPYNYIFQSGIIFMSYNYGLPVIATDVGSLSEDIVEGSTGYICEPKNPTDLANKIDLYFQSDLFKNLDQNRIEIAEYAREKYSWDKIGGKTSSIYRSIVGVEKNS